MNKHVALWVSLTAAACGGSAPAATTTPESTAAAVEPSCAAASANLMDFYFEPAFNRSNYDAAEADAKLAQSRTDLAAACESDAWADDKVTCFSAATDGAGIEHCLAGANDELKQSMGRAVDPSKRTGPDAI